MGEDPRSAARSASSAFQIISSAAPSIPADQRSHLSLAQPWVGIGSDGSAMTPVAPWTDIPTHPRSYGAFARFLGHYVREVNLVSFPEAVRRVTSLPANTLGMARRGLLRPGFFADLVVLDPRGVSDVSTYTDPHRLATGVQWVLVNGVVALANGEPTNKLGGQVLRRGET